MITLNDLKKAKMTALKEHNKDAQSVLGVIISTYQLAEIEKKGKNQEMTDADMVSVLNKTLKALSDEKAMYDGAGRTEDSEAIARQMEIVKSYLPQMMSEEEIRNVISALADKSVKSIMVTFKTQYAGKADMATVSKIAKEFQGK